MAPVGDVMVEVTNESEMKKRKRGRPQKKVSCSNRFHIFQRFSRSFFCFFRQISDFFQRQKIDDSSPANEIGTKKSSRKSIGSVDSNGLENVGNSSTKKSADDSVESNNETSVKSEEMEVENTSNDGAKDSADDESNYEDALDDEDDDEDEDYTADEKKCKIKKQTKTKTKKSPKKAAKPKEVLIPQMVEDFLRFCATQIGICRINGGLISITGRK